MSKIEISRSVPVSPSTRVRQLEAMFDAPIPAESVQSWQGDLDFDFDWQIGLIVGPSGGGKSTVMTELFGEMQTLAWESPSVLDDFRADLRMSEISAVCQAVGFNTIPAWMRPYRVLSTGEQFRADIARRMIEASSDKPIVIDEFTSVVDRQVAKITSHAVQKWIRKHPERRIVVASCHYDIIDWLQPDWMLEMPTMRLERRSVQRRPDVNLVIERVTHHAWPLFAPFHYLTAEFNHSAKCFLLSVEDDAGILRPAAFCGTLHRPHARVDDIEGIHRIVTLPDWQGLGLGPFLADTLGSAFTALGKRFHNYPAHPAFVRVHDRSPNWVMVKRPGVFSPKNHTTEKDMGKFGGRPCAVVKHVGPVMAKAEADALIYGDRPR